MASKKQVPGADAVQAIQESEQGIYRVKGIFTEIFFEDLGRLTMSDVAQFYDPEKDVAILGDDESTLEYLSANPGDNLPNTKKVDIPTQELNSGGMEAGNKFVSQFNAMMTAGSSLPAKRREQANLAISMWAKQGLSLESLYKKLNAIGAGLPSDAKAELLKIKQEREILPPPAKPAKGKTEQVPGAAPVQ